MVQFFLRNAQPKFYPKNGSFGFFQLIKNYAETTLLIDRKYISQEAFYTAQQNSIRIKSRKTCIREKIFYLIVNKCDFCYIKLRIFAYKQILHILRKLLEI